MTASETSSFIDEGRIHEALGAAADKEAGHVREILAKARELGGLEMEEVAALLVDQRPRAARRALRRGARRQGRDLRRAASCSSPRSTCPTCAANDCLYCAFRVQEQGAQAPGADAGGDPPRGRAARRRGPQARPAGRRRVLPEAGLPVRPRLGRDHLLGQARQRRDPPRQRQRRAADGRTSSAPSRRPGSAPTSSSRRPTTARPTGPCTWAARRGTTTGA